MFAAFNSLSPEVKGAAITLASTIALGLAGTLIEAAGNRWKIPALVAFGKKLEAGPNDLPKLLGQRSPDPAILVAQVADEKQPPAAP